MVIEPRKFTAEVRQRKATPPSSSLWLLHHFTPIVKSHGHTQVSLSAQDNIGSCAEGW